MPQLHFYVDLSTEQRIRERAQAQGLTVSKYIASILAREVDAGYPPGFWDDVYGCWAGEPFDRPAQLDYEDREPLSVHEAAAPYR